MVFSSFLLACAGTESDPAQLSDDPIGRGSDCISEMTIRDYSVLDNQNLIVGAGGKRRYHVELSWPAFGLASTWQIGFDSRTGQICPGFSSLLLNDGMGLERVTIRSIRLLDDEQHDDLLVRFGEKEPAENRSPAPREVEGAEVEELD
jgi:hypothetical protein